MEDWDLSKIDFEKLKGEFKAASYKNIEITDLRSFLGKLEEMLNQNRTRRGFCERLQDIIDRYNAGSNSVDDDFEQLVKFAQSLREEEERNVRLGLSEDELEIYDLLCKNAKLAEEQKVRLAAKRCKINRGVSKVLVQDWFKNT